MGHKERIEVPGSEVFGPYSPGVKSHGIVWLAGQIAPEAGDDIASQTEAYFWGPVSVTLDDDGRLYVVEHSRHRVQVYLSLPGLRTKTANQT